MRIAIIIPLFILASALSRAQSPWVAEKGKGYAQLGFTSIGPYKNLFISDGGSYPLSHVISDRTLQLYGEYGVGNHTSVLVSIPFKSIKQSPKFNPPSPFFFPENNVTFSTLGNIQLAARHNFTNEKIALSSQWTIELPTSGHDEVNELQAGLSAISLIPSFSIGKGFSNFYLFASTAFAMRTNNYSSDVRVGAEAGYRIERQIYIIGVLDIVESLKNGSVFEDRTKRLKGLYLNNQSFFAYGIKTIIGLNENMGLTGAYYAAGSGNLVANSPSLNFGFYYKW